VSPGASPAAGAPAPAGDEPRWHEHWGVKVLVWAIPVVFSSGIAFASLRVLAADVERLDNVKADTRITVLETKVRELEELKGVATATNENVIRLCQAQGVACK
jgi:heme/copper-type cytochrome/quinol oxidase subunit 2